MGCKCTKYEPTAAPPVYESRANDVSVYANMQSGTLAYFGPSPTEFKHVAVIINLTDLYNNSGLFLFESDIGGEEYDLLSGTNVDSGARLISLASRLRTLPSNWNVYYQFVDGPVVASHVAFQICRDLSKDPTLFRSAALVARFQAASGRFVHSSDEPSINSLWQGRLLLENCRLSQLIKPAARQTAE